MDRKLVRSLVIAAAFAAVIALPYYGLIQLHRSEDQKAALARAVSTLPAGTEAAWTAYIDRQLSRAIQRDRQNIKVESMGDDILGKTTIVSRNAPYRISCDPDMGIIVWFFGWGDNSLMVPIAPAYGMTLIERHETTTPPLGVDTASIAADRLTKKLCQRVSMQMQETMAAGSEQATP